MKALYLLLILVGLFLAYRVYVTILKSRRNKLAKSITKNPVFKDLMKMQELMGTEEAVNGKVPGGYGEFGYKPTNPIPVKGVFGETSYLGGLRTTDGIKVEFKRLGQSVARNINNPIDMYEITMNGENLCTLHLCPYYKEMSGVAPKGFELMR